MSRAAVNQSVNPMSAFTDTLDDVAAAVNGTLDQLLPIPSGDERRVVEAMRYSSLDGGKRVRPYLVVTSAALFGVDRSNALRAAAALEMVHCYSLIHDDLPAMDNDDLRRGRPTTHKAFDEATAILAGDGLLTLAFAVLADPATHADSDVRLQLVSTLAQAAGPSGMVGGQMLDLLAETHTLSPSDVERMQALKTGQLLTAACAFGAILGSAAQDQRDALYEYGVNLGGAFQIIDDLLDIEGSETETGKSTGKDTDAGKATFVSLYGPERARTQAQSLADQALAALGVFGQKAGSLRAAVAFVIDRQK